MALVDVVSDAAETSDVAADCAGNAARNASTVTNAQNAMNANDTNPNTSKYGTEHGASAEHEPVSIAGQRSSNQW